MRDVMGGLNDVIAHISDFASIVEQKFEQIDKRFEQIDLRFEQMDRRFEKIEETMATKDDLARLENRLMNHIDGLIVMHQKLDVEVVSLRARLERLEFALSPT